MSRLHTQQHHSLKFLSTIILLSTKHMVLCEKASTSLFYHQPYFIINSPILSSTLFYHQQPYFIINSVYQSDQQLHMLIYVPTILNPSKKILMVTGTLLNGVVCSLPSEIFKKNLSLILLQRVG